MTRPWILAAAAMALGRAWAGTPEMAVVQSAAAALGGIERVRAIRTIRIEGGGTNPNVGQNVTPDAPLLDWKVTEYRKTIDLANRRIRLQQRRQAMFAFSMANDVRQNLVLDGDIAYNVDENGKASRAFETAVRDRRIEMLDNPIVIVRTALDPAVKLSRLRTEGKAQLVDLTTETGDELTLAVDRATHLPTSVRWLSSSDNLGDIRNETSFLDYERVGGVELPMRYLTKIDFRGYTTADIHVATNSVDDDAGDLAAPAAVKAATPPVPAPVTVEPIPVVKGIWWLHGSGNHSSVLYEFADHLTLYETPATAALARKILDTARAVVPGKPLTEMIVSHHHFDHSGGLRTVVADGLTIISHRGNEQYFRELVARKATLNPDELARHPKPLKFRGVGERTVLKDDSMEVDLYQIKGNIHSSYNLVAWVPRYRILSQSDLFDAFWYRHLWADNYFQNLETLHLHFDKDVPVHGKILSYDEEVQIVEAYEKSVKTN